MRCKGLKRRLNLEAMPLTVDVGVNAAWSADVGSDTFCDGRSFRILILVDEFSGECLGIEIDQDLQASLIIQVLNRIAVRRGYPRKLRIDYGVELASIASAKWALTHGVELCFIHPTTGMRKGFIERFFGDYNRGVLKKHTFRTPTEVRERTDLWVRDCNRNLRRNEAGLTLLVPNGSSRRSARTC